MAFKIIEGSEVASNRSSHVLKDGEIAIDGNSLYIGDGSTAGGNQIGGPKVSVIRAQRTAGGNSNDGGKWTVTTELGTATAEWEVIGGNSSIRFTLTGYTALPTAFYEMRPNTPDVQTDNFIGSIQNPKSPNVFTNFDPEQHKPFRNVVGTGAFDYYFMIIGV